MPKVIIINIPMMYHCVQSISLMSAASTAFILCIAMLVTKAFSLDCPYNMYITISVIIRVICMAVNMSTLARKLFRNVWNLELFLGLSKFHSFWSKILFLFLYWTARSCSVFRALIEFGLISNVLSDMAGPVPVFSILAKYDFLILLAYLQNNS